ncbi:MAG TPA: hypothetical protein VHZ03_20240 [Trebonia sp.]|nr:hypothetical protein [Trebonia sp.]
MQRVIDVAERQAGDARRVPVLVDGRGEDVGLPQGAERADVDSRRAVPLALRRQPGDRQVAQRFLVGGRQPGAAVVDDGGIDLTVIDVGLEGSRAKVVAGHRRAGDGRTVPVLDPGGAQAVGPEAGRGLELPADLTQQGVPGRHVGGHANGRAADRQQHDEPGDQSAAQCHRKSVRCGH